LIYIFVLFGIVMFVIVEYMLEQDYTSQGLYAWILTANFINVLFLVDFILHLLSFDFKWLVRNNITLLLEFAL